MGDEENKDEEKRGQNNEEDEDQKARAMNCLLALTEREVKNQQFDPHSTSKLVQTLHERKRERARKETR